MSDIYDYETSEKDVKEIKKAGEYIARITDVVLGSNPNDFYDKILKFRLETEDGFYYEHKHYLRETTNKMFLWMLGAMKIPRDQRFAGLNWKDPSGDAEKIFDKAYDTFIGLQCKIVLVDREYESKKGKKIKKL